MNLCNLITTIPHYVISGAAGIIGISLIVAIHEFGHFLFAKLFNVHTPSFSIGFGPQLISKKIGSTLFSFSAIPLGGYVEIAGMAEMGQGEQAGAYATDKTSFSTKPFYQKLCILFGGIFFNLCSAYLMLSLLFMLGAPKSDLLYPLSLAEEEPIIKMISPGSAAERATLQIDDEIIAVNGQPINKDSKLLRQIVRDHPNSNITLLIKRNGKEETITAIADRTEITEANETKFIGTLGVLYALKPIPALGFIESLKQGFRATNIYITMVIHSFKSIIIKKDMTGVGGPVMVISETVKGAQKGFKVFLLFLAIISINLAVLNVLPLPILDGGQILFVTIETITGKELPKLREYIHMASWLLMLALITYLTLKDIGILKWLGFA